LTQDIITSVDGVARQALAAQAAGLGYLLQTTRLAAAIQAALWEFWTQPLVDATAAFRAGQDRQRRTYRLMSLGVPASDARRELRLV
jgi:hypothetical protein